MARSILADQDYGSVSRIRNLPAPIAIDEPVRLGDLNSAVEGLAWKDSVRVATQSNLNLSSPGATIDGVTMAIGDRVLVKAQTAGAENGIYVWNGAAVAMTRALDANTSDELEQAVTLVEEGASANSSWRQTAVNFVIGTGLVSWTQFGAAVPAATTSTSGTVQLATQTEVDTGTDASKAVTPLTLASYANGKRKLSQNIGDGSATQYDVTHNFGTRDVAVAVYRNSGNYDDVEPEVQRPTVNSVRLLFSSAPTSNQYRVVVLG